MQKHVNEKARMKIFWVRKDVNEKNKETTFFFLVRKKKNVEPTQKAETIEQFTT